MSFRTLKTKTSQLIISAKAKIKSFGEKLEIVYWSLEAITVFLAIIFWFLMTMQALEPLWPITSALFWCQLRYMAFVRVGVMRL